MSIPNWPFPATAPIRKRRSIFRESKGSLAISTFKEDGTAWPAQPRPSGRWDISSGNDPASNSHFLRGYSLHEMIGLHTPYL
jgi:hypothetical protein